VRRRRLVDDAARQRMKLNLATTSVTIHDNQRPVIFFVMPGLVPGIHALKT
jgi:hypothetical protein